MTIDTARTLFYEGLDLRELPGELWRSRRVNAVIFVAAVVAALIAFVVLPRWYESRATLTVDTGNNIASSAGGVLGLATQLGLTAGPGSTSPQFFADLLTSRVLRERILAGAYPLGPDGEIVTLEEYWNRPKPNTAPLHERAIRRLTRHSSVDANPRTGIITFVVQGPSPSVAKLMADTALQALNDLVVSVRRRRAAAERQFLEQRWLALRDSLSAHERILRAFYERNRQITSPELQFEDLRLRREVERIQSVYAQVGLQLEQARIQEVRDTPAITIIDPPVEPVRKAAPRGSLVLLIGIVVGAIACLGLALVRMARDRMRAIG